MKSLFPYLENLPADHRIECEGDEWYVIVPAGENWTITINRSTWNADTFEDVKEEELGPCIGRASVPGALQCQ